ncbi:alpha/beta fold hydrolase [Modestobacter sp. I12A-02628]|uniref:Alpha/beta fold hydrolase n=1 Tax=Goekera deserti TaxID=2497753 RepID=A0A7K3WDG4_9ACTN|nr:lipase family protein [Goekera deserti]MPQ96890.1 alpha/beta fold hydrolase [Goekera deserti]NDI46797.1 alpha/beta fold hydrolase [Goekera deserti]NEL54366.1 alpha/beta fold hydrolase [Goekera deserti]
MARYAVLAVVAALVGVAGCSGAESDIGEEGLGDTAAVDIPVAPGGSEFYIAPPTAVASEPGDLIWARQIESPEDGEGYGILYWSTAADGSLIPVSGVLFVPESGADTAPVLAWAHGTDGLGDGCAPSVSFFSGQGDLAALAEHAIDDGAVFVATDYQGLGTPGEHPYMVNELSARNVLDSVRAASRFTGAESPAVALMGQSQGGAAALFAAELQPTYAPELSLIGAAALSVPYGLDSLADVLEGGQAFGYVPMTVHGYGATYPELDVDGADLNDAGRTALDDIGDQCIGQIIEEFAGKSQDDYGLDAVLDDPRFRAELDRNDLGHVMPTVPVFLAHGKLDDTIPVESVRELGRAYCEGGVTVEGKVYPDAGHVDVLEAASDDLFTFLEDRAAGETATSTCDSLTQDR